MAAQWRLVGRDNELVVLRAALVEADTHAVVLSGVSGVGKTRLMTELVAHAAERGWSTQWAVG
ncbi:MAG TPA: ATP-binding protein, partial [Pseudonocardiaceae bacterium]